ncbi:MAG: TRAP transporter substrate-binding protein [Oscillospiraceae bacterium]|nr:TRAP transporter substrate-binding protein [Oscillospiraceae bacterium]
MKKQLKKLLALGLSALLVLAVSGCGSSSSGSESSDSGNSSSSDEVYRLSVSIHDSAQVPKTQYVQKWADAVTEASGGRLEVTVYSGGTLAASTEVLDAVKSGTCSIGVVFSGFFTGQFPLSDVITMPLAGLDNAVQATNVLWDLWESTPEMQAEYEDYKVIMLYAGPNNIICTNTPVSTADDMRGLKLRAAAGTATDMCSGWNATPINMSSSELYQSMEKGVIDGYIIDFTGVNSWSLYEVTNYYTALPFFTQSWSVLMNKDVYESLPEDLQAIIDEYSTRDWSIGFGEVNEEEANEAWETAENEYGSTIIVPEGDDLATFQPAADAYVQNWISSITTDTFDGQAFYDEALALGEQYAQ